jgi:hypothetical protein
MREGGRNIAADEAAKNGKMKPKTSFVAGGNSMNSLLGQSFLVGAFSLFPIWWIKQIG